MAVRQTHANLVFSLVLMCFIMRIAFGSVSVAQTTCFFPEKALDLRGFSSGSLTKIFSILLPRDRNIISNHRELLRRKFV